MPRIRSIKPEMFMSPQVMNLGHAARLLFIGLISQADDEGRGIADPRKLKAVIFAGDDQISSADVTALMVEISAQKLCVTYQTEEEGPLYELPSFREHQYIQKRKPSAYPSPPKQALKGGQTTDTVSVPYKNDNDTGGSDGSDLIGSDGKDLTHGRARGSNPDSKSDARARASERFMQTPEERAKTVEQNRSKAAQIARDIAEGKKPNVEESA